MPGSPGARPPLRERLLVRLVAGFALVAVASIAATAWLAVQNTSGSIRGIQGQVLAGDTRIYDALIGYAASHRNWTGAGPTLRALAKSTGRRIVLTTESRTPLASSEPAGAKAPGRASAVVDPLAVDVRLVPQVPGDRIDPRAVGPFALSTADRNRLTRRARQSAACVGGLRARAIRVGNGPSGRPYLVADSATGPTGPYGVPDADLWNLCYLGGWSTPTTGERAALHQLGTRTNECLKRYGLAGARMFLSGPYVDRTRAAGLRLDDTYLSAIRVAHAIPDPSHTAVPTCLAAARRQQLRPYTAPTALLYIGDPGDGAGVLNLTGAGITRLALLTFGIAVLAVGLGMFLADRLVRPVRALTDAAQRMRGGDTAARVVVSGGGEVGRLAAAFNEMAEHLGRMERQRTAMVSDVSHELRTPLSNVRGWLEAAEDGIVEFDPKLTASLVEETLTLQRVVDDLQELALSDAGKLHLHPEPVDLADLCDQLATAHRGRADAAGVSLTVTAYDGLETVADPVRLRQALGNLLANAIRYTPEGGAVTLRAHRSGGAPAVDVADTGVGIAPDELPHIFDRFWRAEKSRSRRTGGSGLGLAIARNLIDAHDGTLTVTSTPGEGSTFTMRLPVRPHTT